MLLLVSDADEIIRKGFDSIDAPVGLDGFRMMSNENGLLSLRDNQTFLALFVVSQSS